MENKNGKKGKRSTLMAHMVAFYPDERRARIVADAILRGGASYLEVQFPYSDPSADGPSIQRACSRALTNNFTKQKGFAFIKSIASETDIPICIMSYAGLVYSGGVENFVIKAKEAGAAGLIVPDLTLPYDEGLYRYGREAGMNIIPVIAPSISDARLRLIAAERPRYVYVALRAGVTGDRTELGNTELDFIRRVQSIGAKILAGFGIGTREQVLKLQPHVHSLIVGSMIVRTIEKAAEYEDTVLHAEVEEYIRYLVTERGEKEKAHGI